MLLTLAWCSQAHPCAPRRHPRPTFRTVTTLVRVDVVVRDRSGQIVRGLQAADFVVTEDGKAQQITSFNFEEIATELLPGMAASASVLGLEQLQTAAHAVVAVRRSSPARRLPSPPPSRRPPQRICRDAG